MILDLIYARAYEEVDEFEKRIAFFICIMRGIYMSFLMSNDYNEIYLFSRAFLGDAKIKIYLQTRRHFLSIQNMVTFLFCSKIVFMMQKM